MKVMDAMTRSVAACNQEDTLNRAAQLMWEGDCGCIPVLDAGGDVIHGALGVRGSHAGLCESLFGLLFRRFSGLGRLILQVLVRGGGLLQEAKKVSPAIVDTTKKHFARTKRLRLPFIFPAPMLLTV